MSTDWKDTYIDMALSFCLLLGLCLGNLFNLSCSNYVNANWDHHTYLRYRDTISNVDIITNLASPLSNT